ncbi:PaaI family thioesterase [Piscibacillus halophilus]|uniref:Acyl-CoA thioesterase n=1 Tax=Piscibacillus halophilus TaxID=571933 RepID=A0A1H9KEG8_9BACI|nr:PaaI family thioesterase [Piscibacillus halophilus]SEQ97325.1 acyl-CoA thioesterase [Piscibacillus halophilus]
MSAEINTIQQDFEKSPFWRFVGLEVHEASKGNVKLKLPIKNDFMNVRETVHGGVLVSIVDTTMGFTCKSLGFDEVITLQLNTNFVKSVSEGTLYSEGKIISRTRSTAIVEGQIFDEQGELLVHCNGTFKLIKKENI